MTDGGEDRKGGEKEDEDEGGCLKLWDIIFPLNLRPFFAHL